MLTPSGIRPPVSCDPPTLEETKRAVKQLKNGKAPVGCGIYAEMLKAGGAAAFCGLTLLCSIWNTGTIGDGALSFLSGRDCEQ